MSEARTMLDPGLVTDGSVAMAMTAGPGVPERPRKKRRSMRSRLWTITPPAIVAAIAIGLWYLVAEVLLAKDQRYFLPPPHDVIRFGFFNAQNRTVLLSALEQTAKVSVIGLLISIGLGVLVAILMAQAKWLENSLFPWAIILQTVPVLALLPLISFWFGYGLSTRVIICVLIAFFPVVSNTVFGLKAADRGSHELFTLHKSNRFVRLWKLELPAALPAMFAGFRVAGGLSVIGAIVGEFFLGQGDAGLGTELKAYISYINFAPMYAAILLSSLLGIAMFAIFTWLGNRVFGRWYNANRG